MAQYFWNAADTPAPSSITRRLVSNTAALPSQLSYGMQRIDRAGERWEMDVTWGPITGADLAKVTAFLSRLNGSEHSAVIHTFDEANQGVWSGAPVVNGANQTGNQLAISGAGNSVSGWAQAGDYFFYNIGTRAELKRVVANANSDATGNVTLEIMPRIRQSPADGEALKTVTGAGVGEALGEYLLTSPVVQDTIAVNGRGPRNPVATIAVTFIELVQ